MKESVARLKKKLAGGVRVGSRIDGQSRLASRVRALRPSVATRMPRDTLASIVQARVPCRSCDIARHRSISRTPSRPDIRIPIRWVFHAHRQTVKEKERERERERFFFGEEKTERERLRNVWTVLKFDTSMEKCPFTLTSINDVATLIQFSKFRTRFI